MLSGTLFTDGFSTKLWLMKKILLICCGVAFGSSAYADQTCKYEDAEGHIIYANLPIKGAKKLICFGAEGAATPGTSKGPGNSRTITPSPANFPRVDPATQNQRDDKRKQILQEELASELKALEQAKQDYAEGEANPETFHTTIAGKDGKPQSVVRRNVAKFEEKMQKLQANIELHEKNIQLLNKEISSLK
jgi:hypothetical protein